MTKSTITSILVIGICVLILAGSGLMAYFVANPDRGDVISVDLGKPSGDTVKFDDLALLPGQSTEYEIFLGGDVKSDCEVALDFKEEGDKTLKNFVYAKVEYNGKNVYGKDMLLKELLKADTLKFPCELSNGEDHILKITFYMPEDVSNEAENAEADVALKIVASNMD